MKFIRIFHLYVFLLLGATTSFYALSGAIIKHEGWFPKGTSRSTMRLPFDTGLGAKTISQKQARILSQRLATELHLRGRLTKLKKKSNGRWLFVFERPGTVEEITLQPGIKQVGLTVRKAKLAATFNRLHHLHSFKGGGRYLAWGLLVDIVSLALILFAFSGVYLWLASKRNRLTGWIILGGSTAYILGSVIFLLIRD